MFFQLVGKSIPNAVVAMAPDELDVIDFGVELESGKDWDGWRCSPCRGVPFKGKKGLLLDWMPSDLFPKLCSLRMKNFLDDYSSSFVWLPVEVQYAGMTHQYFCPHFNDFPDVIDPKRSTYVNGRIYNRFIDIDKAADLQVFSFSPTAATLVVSANLTEELKKTELTGFKIEKVAAG